MNRNLIIIILIVCFCFIAGCVAEQPITNTPIVQEPEQKYTLIHCPNPDCNNNRYGVTYMSYGENRNYKISVLGERLINKDGKWVVPVVFLCEECGACWMQDILI